MVRYWYQIRWGAFDSWLHLDGNLFSHFFPGRDGLNLDEEITFAGRKGVVVGWHDKPELPKQNREFFRLEIPIEVAPEGE